MDQRCVPVSCAEIPRAAPDCVRRDYRGKLCLISCVNPLNASPAHGTAGTSRQAPGGSACTGAIPGLGTTVLGKGHPHRREAGKTTRRSKGKAAWCPSVPTHADFQRGFGAHEAHPPLFLHLLLAHSEGDQFPKWGRRPSLPTHTEDPITVGRPHAEPALWKKPTFPMAQKKDRYRPQPTASPCLGSGCF